MLLVDESLHQSVERTLVCLWGVTWDYIPSLQSSLLWIRETIETKDGEEIVKEALLDSKNDAALPLHIRIMLLIVLALACGVVMPPLISQFRSSSPISLIYQQLLLSRERFLVSVS